MTIVIDIPVALEKNNENMAVLILIKQCLFHSGYWAYRFNGRYKKYGCKEKTNNIPVLIRDVAEVQLGNTVRYGSVTYNGEKEVVGGIVMMLKGSNSADVCKSG